jgi:FKBP-type peptidyl-prolyl cis-trans isomerase 2
LRIEYTVALADGDVIDGTPPGCPLDLHVGSGEVLDGFEAAVRDRAVGDEFDFVLPPSEAYGERDESLVFRMPVSRLPEGMELEVGATWEVRSEDGRLVHMTLAAVDGDEAVCDFNHPLAGETLSFHVKIVG